MNEPEPPPTIRRRNSITASVFTPTKLSLHTASGLPSPHTNGSTADFELLPLYSPSSSTSYTSLKDLIPSSISAINSPTAAAAGSSFSSAYEISIRNRLVKQAAWAYLQPMSSSPGSSGDHFFRRLWLRLSSRNPVSDCYRFLTFRLVPIISHAFNRIIRFIRIRFNK